MNLFFSYLRVFVFFGCALMGLQVPVFVDQYGKSLESHLTESKVALNEFQDAADKYFDGNLGKLITHYKDNDDHVFSAGGRSIQSIYDRNLMLKNSFEQFQSNTWSAYTQTLLYPVPDISREVRKNFSYAVQLRPNAVAFGLIIGLVFTLGLELLLRLLLQVPKLFNKKRDATRRYR